MASGGERRRQKRIVIMIEGNILAAQKPKVRRCILVADVAPLEINHQEEYYELVMLHCVAMTKASKSRILPVRGKTGDRATAKNHRRNNVINRCLDRLSNGRIRWRLLLTATSTSGYLSAEIEKCLAER